jgi:dTMP kinase
MPPARGHFITVEGIEGAGKTTALARLGERLEERGLPLLVTREPGGTPLGEDLRELLLGHRHDGMSSDAELLLMFAARAEHLRRRIEPALASGCWVLCDRFTDATYAYQGGGRELGFDRIAALETWVQGGLRPDLTLLLDLPVALGLERAGRRSAPDRFEREQRPFFERVRSAYLAIAHRDPDRVKVVNAAQPPAGVAAALRAALDGYLARVG